MLDLAFILGEEEVGKSWSTVGCFQTVFGLERQLLAFAAPAGKRLLKGWFTRVIQFFSQKATRLAQYPQCDTDHRLLKPFLHWLRKKDPPTVSFKSWFMK